MAAGGSVPDDGGDGEFWAFVAARGPALVRLAFHVCRDAATAEVVTVATLSGMDRSWATLAAAGRPGRHAQGDIVRRALAAGRPAAAEDPTAALWLDGAGAVDERVLQSYAALPPDQRAAVALVVADGLEPREADETLGLSPGTSAQRVAAAIAAIDHARRRAADEFDADLPSGRTEDHCRRVLLTSADAAGLADSLVESVTAARRRRATRRRVLVGGGAAAVLAGAALALRGRDRPPPVAAIPSGSLSTAPPGATDNRWSVISTWPPRGALTRDRDLLDALRRTPELQDPHLFYADRIDSTDVALLTEGSTNVMTIIRTTRGPGGWLEPQGRSTAFLADELVVSVAEYPSAPGYLLVLVPPTDNRRVVVSRSVEFLPEGGARRTDWTELPLVDGIGLTNTGPAGGAGIAVNAGKITPVTIGNFDVGLGLTSGDVQGPGAQAKMAAVLTERAAALVAALVGRAPEEVTTDIAWTTKVSREAAKVLSLSSQAVLTVYLTRVPGGAVLRSVTVHGSPQPELLVQDYERLLPYPALGAADRPVLLMGAGTSERTGSLCVFHPTATTCVGHDIAGARRTPSAPFRNRVAIFGDVDLTVGPQARVELFDKARRSLGSWLWFEEAVANPLANY